MKTFADVEKVSAAQLRGMTPPQIDELWYQVDLEYARLKHRIEMAWNWLHHACKDKKVRGEWQIRRDELQESARKIGDKDIREALARLDAAQDAVYALNQGVYKKFKAEEDRRGGWDRAFLVTDGHVHSTRSCFTCSLTTRFVRMFEYSGMSEAEIIKAASDRACTFCYPNAPVAKGEKVPKSVMLTPEEKERAEKREAERVKREAKKAKAAEGAITDVDGSPLYDKPPGMQFRSVVKTLRTARMELTDEVWYRDNFNHPEDHIRVIEYLAPAIAKKEGKDVATVIREAEVRAKKRR